MSLEIVKDIDELIKGLNKLKVDIIAKLKDVDALIVAAKKFIPKPAPVAKANTMTNQAPDAKKPNPTIPLK